MAPPAHVDETDVDELRERCRGSVLRPDDDGYDEVRTVWNARIDREPAVIARCIGTADVIAAVTFARAQGLVLSVKSGGHHVSGTAVCDDGLMIDLGPMDAVHVDPDARTARVEAGATWGEVDAETQAFGLAVPGGQDPNIGVAGLTLGGGVGWLSRKYGLTCDNMLSAEVVTATGELVRASADEHPELFWALRGGGGNFGIVTSFEFRLHAVGPEIFAGSLIYPLADFADVARAYREFMVDAPREVRLLLGSMELPAASYYPEAIHETRVTMLITFYGGPPQVGKEVLAPLRAVGEPLLDSIRRRPYTAWQGVGDSQGSMRTHLRSQYLETLSDAAIDTIVTHTAESPSSGSTVFVSPRSGAETDPPTNATAYAHRDPAHHLLIETRWTDPIEDEPHIAWTDAFHDAMKPHTNGEVAMNFLTDDEGEERRRAAYGENYERLVEVKTAWDPENVFRMNQNIEPTG